MSDAKEPTEEMRSAVATTIHDYVSSGINDLLTEVIKELPEGKLQVDGLRAVHVALASHLGSVERMLSATFEKHGVDMTPQILEERELGIKAGTEHVNEHLAQLSKQSKAFQ